MRVHSDVGESKQPISWANLDQQAVQRYAFAMVQALIRGLCAAQNISSIIRRVYAMSYSNLKVKEKSNVNSQ